MVDGDFQVGGVTFRGGWGSAPGYFLTDVEGLLSGGEVSHSGLRRSRGVGQFDTRNRRDEERVITFRGDVEARSELELGGLLERLSGVLVENEAVGPLAWDELGRRRFIPRVRRAAGWSVNRRGSKRHAEFVARFRAPDQRVFGESLGTTGWGASVTVTNRGTHPAPVVLSIRGTAAGYTVTAPNDRRLVVSRDVTAGVVHTYDADTGILRVGSTAVTTGVDVSDVIEIPPGVHTVTVNAGLELNVAGYATFIP